MVQTEPCRSLDLNAACAPVSPHRRYHHDAVAGVDEPLDVHPEISDVSVKPLGDGGEPRWPFGFPVTGIARVDPLDIGVQQARLRWGDPGAQLA